MALIVPALQPKVYYNQYLKSPNSFARRGLRYREEHIRTTGWSIITQETVNLLANIIRNKVVVEVFAGTGVVAHHLRPYCRRYHAYDNYSTHQVDGQCRYPGVTKKNAFMAPVKDAGVIVMSWPEYDSPHAYRIARKMVPGQVLIYNGEGYGGCTGDDRFNDYLSTHFTPLTALNTALEETHVQFYGIRDRWCVYVKHKGDNRA